MSSDETLEATKIKTEALRAMALDSLEAARVEVVERISAKGFPTSMPQSQLLAKYKDDGTGTESEWASVQVSTLRDHDVQMAIRDDSVPHSLLGLKPQIAELAQYLAENTHLGAKRSQGFLPGMEGVDGVLARCLVPLTMHYLNELQDVAVPNLALAGQLVDDLVAFAEEEVLWHVRQLTLVGLRPKHESTHRDVSLRPLNELERGAIWETDSNLLLRRPWTGKRDYRLPASPIIRLPDSALTVRTNRPRSEIQDKSRLIQRVVLAFFLSDIPLHGFGDIFGFDLPAWATGGTTFSPFPLHGSSGTDERIDEEQFARIVDLAYRIPEFTNEERTQQEIALDRALKAYGAPRKDAGFLDFMIALEAMLLSNIRTELRYRFSLYGALFLREELKAEDTFKRLLNAYDVRSAMVHGCPVSSEDRSRAVDDARDLATRVLRCAIERGWPDSTKLDRVALASPITSEPGK